MQSGLAISHLALVRLLSVGTTLALALWNLIRLWVGKTERGNRFRDNERHAERKRIARELHDTLLQGLQGILLEVEVLSSRIPEDDRERAAKIERKLRHIVVDGRNAINALRMSNDERDWIAAVLEMGERASSDSQVNFMMKINGELWKLPSKVRVEVLAIVREGLRNAFDHSGAMTIVVFIRCAKRALRISIRDNGVGFNERHLESRQKEGHWGLAGMRERAEKLRGRLTITSRPSKGTVVNLLLQRRLVFIKPGAMCMSENWRRWSRRQRHGRFSLLRWLSRRRR